MQKRSSGFTLIEVTIILMVLAVLGLILLPTVENWVNLARMTRMQEDLQVIGSAVSMMLFDTGECCFWLNGSTAGTDPEHPGGAPVRSDYSRIEMLVSNGDIPAGNGSPWVHPWLKPYSVGNGTFDVDFLEYHLCTNTPGGGIGTPYRQASPIGNSAHEGFAQPNYGFFSSRFGWKGAYVTPPINADPWGNRYMVNTEFLDTMPDQTSNYVNMSYDVFVLSAGPNEVVETPFAMDGAHPGGDDGIFIISGGAH